MSLSGTKTRLRVIAGELPAKQQDRLSQLKQGTIEHLRPVSPEKVEHLSSAHLTRGAPRQQMALPFPSPNCLAIIDMSAVQRADFVQLLEQIRPRIIFDIRTVPLFDLDPPYMNRRRAFEIFQKLGAAYYDVTGQLGITSSLDARLNPAMISGNLSSLLKKIPSQKSGPVAIFTDSQTAQDDYYRFLPSCLFPMPIGGWQVLKL